MRQFRPRSRMHAAVFGVAFGALSSFIAITVFALSSPAAWADGCTPPANGPSGPDAAAFTYQCDGADAGEWTSPYYVYNPATAAKTPLYNETYKYDCANSSWQQNEWDYNAATAAYVENWVPATAVPNQPTGCPVATATSATPPTPTPVPAAATPAPTDTPTGTGKGKDSGTSSAGSANSTGTAVDNTVGSASQSGDATVAHNRQAGDAASGNSTTETTVNNLVGTTAPALANGVATFTTTLDNMNGNFILDPSAVLPAGNAVAGQPPAALSSTTTDTAISNTITATAQSGNAVVAGNGDAGNATSGDAKAIVNLINMINSAVAAGQSFIGTINITGDMNGNILIPQSVIDQLLASNADSGNSGSDPNAASVANTTNTSIVNNVVAAARSGDATVAGNSGSYGTATTGQANTNVTVLNLTGSSVVGKNVLLVFVNVLGKWVGMIMNAPAGSTSAEFGGGISSNNTLPSSPSGTAGNAVEASANMSITNNVTASATSGDAAVIGNHDGGNAQSGNADTAVNILNIANSELSLANWFGILFINVFGTWNGNFGIQPTPVPAAPGSSDPSDPSTPTGQADGIATAAFAAVHGGSVHHFAAFVPSPSTPSGTGSTSGGTSDTAILGDATAKPSSLSLHSQAQPAARDSVGHANYLLTAGGVLLAALLLLAAERDKLRHGSND